MGEHDGEDYREKLEKHRVEIVQGLDLDRQYILSHLRSKFVLDDEDSQIILNAGPSRQQKSAKFIDILITKGPAAFVHFVQGLEIEHPHLYEVVTGMRPVGRRLNVNSTPVIPWAVLTDKQLLDFDREFLVKELAKLSEANTRLAYMHGRIMTEKHTIEKKYEDTLHDLDRKDVALKELQNELERKQGTTMRSSEISKEFQKYRYHCQELIRDNSEKSNIIIALQSKLLAVGEDIENNTKRNDELRRKNETLMQQVRDLTINYDWQRTRSKRLSAQVDNNNDVIRLVKDKKNEMYELKFQLAHVTEERDDALHRLNEFKRVMQALNAKMDILQQEKNNEEVTRDQVSEDYLALKEKIHVTENALVEEQNKVESLCRKNERLRQEIETHKEQRDFYLTERKNAIRNWDQVMKERDDAMRFNRELQKSRDEAVCKQIELQTFFEKKSAEATLELEKLQEEMRSSIMWYENEIKLVTNEERNEQLQERKVESSDSSEEEIEDEAKLPVLYPWRDRTKTEVLQSAYNKLHKRKTKPPQLPRSLNCTQMQWIYNTLSGEKSPVSELYDNNLLINSKPNDDQDEEQNGDNNLQLKKKNKKIPNTRHNYNTVTNLYPFNSQYETCAESVNVQSGQCSSMREMTVRYEALSVDDSCRHRKLARSVALSSESTTKRRSHSMLPLPSCDSSQSNEITGGGLPKSPKPVLRNRTNAFGRLDVCNFVTMRQTYLLSDYKQNNQRRASEPCLFTVNS